MFQVGGCAYNSNATRNFDPVLAVYDGHLRLLTTKNASRYGEGERVSARVRVAGRYFLRVANHAGAESPGSYSVAVRMQPYAVTRGRGPGGVLHRAAASSGA